ncbi:MAG: hypothetical protein GFH27_549281n20 [Chloroflexi bacterium AL-W]|nr:hypothetical protein [Chloroflexi bacterium AL-N1]NOK65906.1 hypothetical protein [Chloroflexi bacterium AL-N10]NOK72787.1 hypothetical protein [Chloroflexi bacterium AL-N5]NOK79684.1 hypothetical protein [Chloroflexi bacterium AL-W]NOK93009.1 hypothetical protein [Chloroflexi bacterium AL-N15]
MDARLHALSFVEGARLLWLPYPGEQTNQVDRSGDQPMLAVGVCTPDVVCFPQLKDPVPSACHQLQHSYNRLFDCSRMAKMWLWVACRIPRSSGHRHATMGCVIPIDGPVSGQATGRLRHTSQGTVLCNGSFTVVWLIAAMLGLGLSGTDGGIRWKPLLSRTFPPRKLPHCS